MSGFGAPSRIPTPIPARPSTARVSATTSFCLISASSCGGLRTATSNGCPDSIFLRVSGLTANSTVVLCPVDRSKRAASSSTAARAPFPLSTFTSAACAEKARSSRPSVLGIAQFMLPGVSLELGVLIPHFKHLGKVYRQKRRDRAVLLVLKHVPQLVREKAA